MAIPAGNSWQAHLWVLDHADGCGGASLGLLWPCELHGGCWALPWELLTHSGDGDKLQMGGGRKSHSLSLEKFLKMLLDFEWQPHGSSARLGLHTERGLILQWGLCFEVFAPPAREKRGGRQHRGCGGTGSPSPAHSPARAGALLSPASGSPG